MPFFTHGDTKNKLILLYILASAKTPLTHDQMYRVVDRTDSMSFFSFETILPELESDGFLASFVRPFGDCYGLTDHGMESVELFKESIPTSTRERIDKVVKESEFDFLRETQTTSRLSGNEEGGYSLELLVLNGEQTVFGITLSVASKEAALIMRSNWESKSGELYDSIWNTLYHPSDEE